MQLRSSPDFRITRWTDREVQGMYHLRLVKGKTYWGIVKASEEEPDVFVQEKEKADHLVKTGFFSMVGEETEQDAGQKKQDDGDAENVDLFSEEAEEETQEKPIIMELQGMTKAELTEYAEKKGIDITGCRTKDDIFQRVIDAIARADEVRAALRE